MIVQDQYSGYFHEVPDQLMGYDEYGQQGEVVYDGFGNAVGFAPFDFIKKAVSNIPIVGGLVSNLIPGGSAAPAAAPQLPFPGMPFSPSLSTLAPAFSSMFRPPQIPSGWMRPQLPYTGLGPRRMYMRCAVWPGPRGLVPQHAANMLPGMQPGQPGTPALPGLPGGGGRMRRRSRARRR
jgi:hypothetical protein